MLERIQHVGMDSSRRMIQNEELYIASFKFESYDHY